MQPANDTRDGPYLGLGSTVRNSTRCVRVGLREHLRDPLQLLGALSHFPGTDRFSAARSAGPRTLAYACYAPITLRCACNRSRSIAAMSAPPGGPLSEMDVRALHALAMERELSEDDVEAAMDSGEPKAALIRLLTRSDEASRIAAAFAEGTAEEREAAYAALETAARTSPSSGSARAQAVALAAAGVKPLIVSVLCAPD